MLRNDSGSISPDRSERFMMTMSQRTSSDGGNTSTTSNPAAAAASLLKAFAAIAPKPESWRLDNPISNWDGIGVNPSTAEVVSINLQGKRLTGQLSALHLPRSLKDLGLGDNLLTGEIDWEYLPRGLERLWLHNNDFSGKLNLNVLPSQLEILFLHDNPRLSVVCAQHPVTKQFEFPQLNLSEGCKFKLTEFMQQQPQQQGGSTAAAAVAAASPVSHSQHEQKGETIASLQQRLDEKDEQIAKLITKLHAAQHEIMQLKEQLRHAHQSTVAAETNYVFMRPYAFDAAKSNAFLVASNNKRQNVVPIRSLLPSTATSSTSNAKLVIDAPVPVFLQQLWQRGGKAGTSVTGFTLVRFDAVFHDDESSAQEELGFTQAREKQLLRQRATNLAEFHDSEQFSKLPPAERAAKEAMIAVLKSKFVARSSENSLLNYLYSFHGCSSNVVASVLASGLHALHRNDGGFFSAGCYSTPGGIEYAARYATGEMLNSAASNSSECITNYAPSGCCFPVLLLSCGVAHANCLTFETEVAQNPDAAARERGESIYHAGRGQPSKALKPGCDAHFVAVSEQRGYLCCKLEDADYFELVQRDSELCVPLGVLWLRKN